MEPIYRWIISRQLKTNIKRAVKRLIAYKIKKIIYIIYVCILCIFIIYIYKYTNMHVYI